MRPQAAPRSQRRRASIAPKRSQAVPRHASQRSDRGSASGSGFRWSMSLLQKAFPAALIEVGDEVATLGVWPAAFLIGEPLGVGHSAVEALVPVLFRQQVP